MARVDEIPMNEARKRTDHIPQTTDEAVAQLLSALHEDANDIMIELASTGQRGDITTHYAVMDLAQLQASISTKIRDLVNTIIDNAL